ncbi:hypothetical protein V6N11_037271 [Hibiscus sabdariffa]|uniref:Uncharacterized protein n=1 Tax=Hibiscus sabdariffa TaxID=183260 RepID=A0ABR2P0V6_9ROSI
MGNWFGRSKLMVNDISSRNNSDSTSSPTSIKVRITKTRLEELKAQAADMSKGELELGRLIVKECSEGRLSPCAVVGQVQPRRVSENSRSLSTIEEEKMG